MHSPPKVVVIGAGFGGMQAAQSLASSGAEILLIDRNTHNTFIPLLYQVATAQIEPEFIAYPVRNILRQSQTMRFLRAEVEHVDFVRQHVRVNGTTIAYDYLILATGSQTHYLSVPGAAEHAFALRTLEDAVALRDRILTCVEQAAREADPVRRRQLLTFVIAGGGPTGVEIAGALVELKRSLGRHYPHLDLNEMHVSLAQSGTRLLANLPEPLGRYTARKLERLGIPVRLQTRVTRVTPTAVEFDDGSSVAAATVVWAAGLEAALPDTTVEPYKARNNKLAVQPTLQLQRFANVYAIGDLAHAHHNGKPLSGVAPEALQQGGAVARNIGRQMRGQSPQPFRYVNKGRLAIIGCYAGVGQIGPIRLTGFLPWLMWLSVHVVYLPGFRSRLFVLLSWIHGYALHDRPVRQILSSTGVTTRQLLPPIHNVLD
ncbi:MAG: NAD(P)/FAD-dependent oxidoreductase [Cyanobacteria bacterium J06642_2]